MLLLTWHGTLACLNGPTGALSHTSPRALTDEDKPLRIDLSAMTSEGLTSDHPTLGRLGITPDRWPNCINVSRQGRLLRAEAATTHLDFESEAAQDWESFLPVSDAHIRLLTHLLTHSWIECETRAFIPMRTIELQAGYRLLLNGLPVPLTDLFASTATATGQAAAGQPDELLIEMPDATRRISVAHPRHSKLVDTAKWPVRARRHAEIVVLATHRHVTGYEPEQAVFERDVTRLLASNGLASLTELLEDTRADWLLQSDPAPAVDPVQSAPEPLPAADTALHAQAAISPDPTPRILSGWALSEMAPWQLKPINKATAMAAFEALNASRPWSVLFHFQGGDVWALPKPGPAEPGPEIVKRTQHYLAFFRSLSPLLPSGFDVTICMCVADRLHMPCTVPVFAFQKSIGDAAVLMPDIDCLEGEFYTSDGFRDTIPYENKAPGAVFSGSTTGGLITPESVEAASIPRLEAAAYFENNPLVDFRLPNIVQCKSPEARAMLKAKSYCRKPWLSWEQQFHYRFLLSMDGNGATCSRVAVSLLSNGVLLKYTSKEELYYFRGLQPWVHYVPIAQHSDVDAVLALERREPEWFAQIAAAGSDFARTYLSSDSTRIYAADLLKLYAACFTDAQSPIETRAPARNTAPPTMTAPALAASTPHSLSKPDIRVLAHLQNVGDTWSDETGLIGKPKSGLSIEGFSIHPAPYLALHGFQYQAALEPGTFSEPGRAGDFLGSRGQNRPVFGLRITIEEAATQLYDVVLHATFVDGTEVGPIWGRAVLEAASGAPLESVRMTINKR